MVYIVRLKINLHPPLGGRGVAVGPIFSETKSDIFCDNENGPNFLFHNNGDGTFKDVAADAGEQPFFKYLFVCLHLDMKELLL